MWSRFSVSEGAQEGTITVEGSTNPEFKGKNLQLADFHPVMHGVQGHPLCLTAGAGDITLPLTTPGEIKRLRIGAHHCARNDGP